MIDSTEYEDKRLLRSHVAEIVEGLNYIHQEGVLHRDLNPNNIFVDSYNQVKIGDFSLSRSMR